MSDGNRPLLSIVTRDHILPDVILNNTVRWISVTEILLQGQEGNHHRSNENCSTMNSHQLDQDQLEQANDFFAVISF